MKFKIVKGEPCLRPTTGEHWRRKRLRIFLRDDWRCFWCSESVDMNATMQDSPRSATVDHIIPIARGGGNEDVNLVTSCNACNHARGNTPAEEFLLGFFPSAHPVKQGEGRAA